MPLSKYNNYVPHNRHKKYKHIFSPAKGHITRERRLVRARIAVFVVAVASIVVMIPNYLMNKLVKHTRTIRGTNDTETIYVIDDLRLGTPDMKLMTGINLWIMCIFTKFLPSILMVVYSGLLVRTVRLNVRMLEQRRRTGSAGTPRRPSESYFASSVVENSQDLESTSRRGSSDILGKAKTKKNNKKNYQQLTKKEENECDAPRRSFFSPIVKNKNHCHVGNGNSQNILLEKQNCDNGSVMELIEHNGRSSVTRNEISNDDQLGVPMLSTDGHSNDSGVHSNTSHDQLTYQQQMQMNLQYHQQHHVIHNNHGESNTVKDSTKNNNIINNGEERRKLLSEQPSPHEERISINTSCLPVEKVSPVSRSPINGTHSPNARARNQSIAASSGNSRSQDSARTTFMLLLVICLFLVTELPQGFLIALSVTIPNFFNNFYIPLGDIMDQLALLNNGINFFLYCSMSRDFRTTLVTLLRRAYNNCKSCCVPDEKNNKAKRRSHCPSFQLTKANRKHGIAQEV